MPLEVGTLAPDFTLKDQNNQEVSLSSFRGEKNVLLVFYPLAFTGICQGELCKVRDELPKFQNDNAEILAISVGPPPPTKSGPPNRATPSPSCPTSGPTAPSPSPTASSTKNPATPTAALSSSTRTASSASPK
ncbi:hypothetical protein NSERKGN1266_23750 [Nocardia seriolae]|nr:hypothetical protein NSERKGN1266_23750 [Nocardia seriolae]